MREKTFRKLEFDRVLEIVADCCKTEGAKDRIRNIKLYDNLYEVNKVLEETHDCLRYVQEKGRIPIVSDRGLREAYIRAEKDGILDTKELLKIGKFLRSVSEVLDYLKNDDLFTDNIRETVLNLIEARSLETNILNCIIDENEINDNASRALFAIRKALRNRNQDVKDKVSSMVRTYSKYLMDNLYTVRGDRYVLPVKAEHKGSVRGMVHDVSSTGATIFIEPLELVNINNEIKELKIKEAGEIEKILKELSIEVKQNSKIIAMDQKIIEELDYSFAKASFGRDNGCVKPKVNDRGYFDIKGGRHPMIDREKVVPLDIHCGDSFTSIIITGPNTGGKTVALKTVGLLHLMAQSGMLIPADDGSEVALFEAVYADLGDEQSIEQSLSTFSSHMTNIISILERAGFNSLVLFDELGAGTDPTEGSALAISILDELRARGSRVICTTHYSQLKAYCLNTEGVENASVEFDVETLRPTYRLLMGIPGKSNAFEVSLRLGLSADLIKKAKETISKDTLEFEDLIRDLNTKTMEAEKLFRENNLLRNEAKDLYEKYKSKLSNIDKTREKSLKEGKDKAQKIIQEAKEEADRILKDMRDMEKFGLASGKRHELEKMRKELKDKMDNMNTAEVKKGTGDVTKLQEGDEVKVLSLDARGIVQNCNDNKKEATIQVGIMKVNVKYEDLQYVKEQKQEKKVSKRKLNLNLKSVSTSLDIRGKDSEEGIYETDLYLDEAFVGGLQEVTIIHGKGTGVLKSAIVRFLRTHVHVKSFRDGDYNEGGNGVTVVRLK